MNRRSFLRAGAGLGSLCLSGCAVPFGKTGSYAGQVVAARDFDSATFWIDVLVQQARDSMLSPPRVAYCLAGPTIAGFVAANAVSGRFEDNFGLGPAPRGADPEVAYGAAFATVASEVLLTPLTMQRLAFMTRFTDGAAKSLGAEWGRKVGLHFVKMRTFDGSGSSKLPYYFHNWPRRGDVLQWLPTGEHYATHPGPAFDDYARGLNAGQGKIKPWSIQNVKAWRADPFYDPRSPEFAEEFHLLHTLGAGDSTIRTADQTQIAIFWEDGPWGATTSGHLAQIAMQMLAMRGFGFLEKARAYALIGMGQCDASIVAWYNKYSFDILRPETAIRVRARQFANPDPRVVPDPKWKTVINTPNFPSYIAGHSALGSAATRTLAHVLGGDAVSFSHQAPDQVIWPVLRGKTRHFTSLSQLSEENGMSRIYGGVHWLRDHQASTKLGYALADHITATYFKARG